MSVSILRPSCVVDPVEAMRLRDNFNLVVEAGRVGVILDLTGVQELSTAGLIAVTHIIARGRRGGISIRLLLPECKEAARVIENADLWRFLRLGGTWNPLPPEHRELPEEGRRRPTWILRHQNRTRRRHLGRTLATL